MRIAIVGTGYVGLVSGACFAEMGLDITCVDTDRRKIAALNEGRIPIYEPGLEEIVRRNFDAGRLHFTTDLAACLGEVEVVFSAVGTPPREDGSADLSQVFEVARTFGRHIGRYTLLVTKSTVPVGTAERIRRIVAEGAGGTRRGGAVRRGVEPRIPQGGCGRQGFHVARPRGGGRRERTRPAADGAALPSVPDKQLPRAVHGHRLGRNDQIRRQRHAGDAHLVHERHRQPLRPRGGRRRDGPQRASAPTPASATNSSTPAADTAARASRRTCRHSPARPANTATRCRSSRRWNG